MPYHVYFNGTFPVRFSRIGVRKMWEVVAESEATPFTDKDKAHEHARAYEVKTYAVSDAGLAIQPKQSIK
jgi:hypothetical protein